MKLRKIRGKNFSKKIADKQGWRRRNGKIS